MKTIDKDSGTPVKEKPLEVDKGKGGIDQSHGGSTPQKSTVPKRVIGKVFKDGKLVTDYEDVKQQAGLSEGRTWDTMKAKK